MTNRRGLGWLFSGLTGILVALGVIYWPAPTPPSTVRTSCDVGPKPDAWRCDCLTRLRQTLDDERILQASIAWKYFERNYHPETGLINSVDGYPSTTMWDTASAIFGTVAARHLCLIDDRKFHERISRLLGTLNTMPLYDGVAPNKAYDTRNAQMVDYNNNPAPEGIGVSTIDLARLISSLRFLSAHHPEFVSASRNVIARWNYCPMIRNGRMYGLYRDPLTMETVAFQEGRLGYEQYAGKIFAHLGFDQHLAADYRNPWRGDVRIDGVSIAYDTRDPSKLGAYNYVVTESYALEWMELPDDDPEFDRLWEAIYQVQRRHSEITGELTAASEDHVDRKPYFLYNTIFVAGSPWRTITDKGMDYPQLRTLSVKAALALADLHPEDEYAKQLRNAVRYANDPDKGWFSGIYQEGQGYNRAITANTNGIILELIARKSGLNIRDGWKNFGFPSRLPVNADAGKQCIPIGADRH